MGLAAVMTGAAAIAGAGAMTGVGKVLAKISFAAKVPSVPQLGQPTGAGIRLFTGSTSNAYFVPHPHWILISIAKNEFGFEFK